MIEKSILFSLFCNCRRRRNTTTLTYNKSHDDNTQVTKLYLTIFDTSQPSFLFSVYFFWHRNQDNIVHDCTRLHTALNDIPNSFSW